MSKDFIILRSSIARNSNNPIFTWACYLSLGRHGQLQHQLNAEGYIAIVISTSSTSTRRRPPCIGQVETRIRGIRLPFSLRYRELKDIPRCGSPPGLTFRLIERGPCTALTVNVFQLTLRHGFLREDEGHPSCLGRRPKHATFQ